MSFDDQDDAWGVPLGIVTDPANKAEYEDRLASFLDSLKPLDQTIAAIKAAHAGSPVTATEPVFGYMATALGLTMRNERFQRAVMNGTEPSASDIAAFETDLRQHRVKLLLFNTQSTSSAAQRQLGIAKASGRGSADTNAGQIKGKAAYMSPEQVKGLELDRRTDVFALGTLLYLMTTGKHPFRGANDVATLYTISSDKPFSIRSTPDTRPSFPNTFGATASPKG